MKKISSLIDETNALQEYVKEIKDDNEKKPMWTGLDASEAVKDFPRLSLDDLMELTLVIYQVKQTKAYTIEHIDPDGTYEIKVTKVDEAIIFNLSISI